MNTLVNQKVSDLSESIHDSDDTGNIHDDINTAENNFLKKHNDSGFISELDEETFDLNETNSFENLNTTQLDSFVTPSESDNSNVDTVDDTFGVEQTNDQYNSILVADNEGIKTCVSSSSAS